MENNNNTYTTKVIEANSGKNQLVNDLYQRRIYDSAVDELNAKARRPKVHFPKCISQEQVLLATNSYPEFEIMFSATQNAVHSFAGGLRALELEYLMTLVPYGFPTYDIGGNFASHLFKGRSYVHCCMPNLDIRDVARHESQKESVNSYLAKLGRTNRTLPRFQVDAFSKYHEAPDDICCFNKFEECSTSMDGDTYAVALHSIYDIPADGFGAALLRKNVKFCFAAFHFSENLLLEVDSANMSEIGASFTRSEDKVSFFFHDESTLNYEHSYKNILHYVVRTFFPASNRFVYHKEFLCTRVNTWFCKFTRVDTYSLFRSMYSKQPNTDAFYEAMEDSWHYKKTLAMLNVERTLFKDHAAVNFWFPKMKNMVIMPLFQSSIVSRKTRRREILVNKDFVYTVLNHIKTYQAKALTYQNVLSFVESIRSRVIINGVTARSEWDVDKSVLQPLAMTFFLQTKLSAVQDEITVQYLKKGEASLSSLLWQKVEGFFGDMFPSLKEQLVSSGFIKTTENKLEIKLPDLYVTFPERFVTEYKKTVDMEHLDISKPLEKYEQLWKAVSELSTLSGDNFDFPLFEDLCAKANVDIDIAAKVVNALKTSGLTAAYTTATEKSVSEILSLPKRDDDIERRYNALRCVYQCPPPDISMKKVAENDLPLQAITNEARVFESVPEDELYNFQGKCVKEIQSMITSKMIYTGSLRVQQMKNYMDYLVASISAASSNLSKLIKDTYGSNYDTETKAGVYDVRANKWIIKPQDKAHAWGVVEDESRRIFVSSLKWGEEFPICEPTWIKVAVSTDTLLYSDVGKYNACVSTVRTVDFQEPKTKIILVDGVPGCGKTKEILEKCDFETDLVLVPGKEASKMIIKRANGKGNLLATKDNVRTVDSFLMHPKPRTYKRLFIDEGLMLHPGCVYFLVQISCCEVAYVYGDTQKIPFINRIANFPFPAHFAKLQYNEVETRRTTLRCPADVTHYLNSKYDGHVVCTSDVQSSVTAEVVPGRGTLNPVSKPLRGKIVTFTQSDKAEMLHRGYKDVHTVHEIQGETYEDVSIVRLTSTPLSIISAASPHVLVSLTRHTRSVCYYTVVFDPLVKIITDLSKVSSFVLDMYKVESGPR
ncbi:protein 126 [Hoya chlorotic spot virus]|nr:protein 126 [Hoya chlorotic spot virus]ARI47179.1 protein 126 [Hoya chlorotic spot virus]